MSILVDVVDRLDEKRLLYEREMLGEKETERAVRIRIERENDGLTRREPIRTGCPLLWEFADRGRWRGHPLDGFSED